MRKKDSPLSVYAVVSQISFTVLSPLLLFIVGGYFACRQFGWDDWVMGLCVALGIIFMVCGAVAYFRHLIKLYAKDNKEAPRNFNSSGDNDYYND